jgi:quinoprotein dehydrogenase-associated probable ABC transporter substrate-binding protein
MKLVLVCLFAALAARAVEPERMLRVCSDPNNLPFSNQNGQGFENKIAEVLAHDLDAKLDYQWWAQRKNFIDRTLKAGRCDVVMGLPSSFPNVLATRPYYRSSYVLVYRKDGLRLSGLRDPALANLRIGIHVVDANLAPPAQVLARRGIIENVKGYSLFGPYGEPNPPAKIIDAVRKNEIDVAIVWGPLGGYFGRGLTVVPVADDKTNPSVPLSYDISIAVRPSDAKLKARLQSAMDHRRTEIRRILASYGVPL